MQIFISYSSADEAKAKELAGRLEKAGYKCWISCDNLNADHPVAIPQEIAKSDAVIMVISEHSKDAPGQETEMKLAEKKGVRKEIIPFLLEEVEPADTWLAWPLTGRQSIRGYEQEGWDRLIKRLAELKTCSEGDDVDYDIPQLGKTAPVVNLTTLKDTSDIMHFNHALQFDRLLRPRRALEELRKISKQDDLIVRYYTLRIRYTLEGGVDEIELEDAFVKACNLGCADAKVNLASKYLEDWDSKGSANASVNQCMEWLKEAIIAGEPEALVELAAYYEGKHGVSKGKAFAEKLYRQAIDAGSLMGRINLGLLYWGQFSDNNNDVKSRIEAEDVLRPILLEHLLKNEADADKIVHLIIALAYFSGIVVQQDYSLAMYFSKKVLSSRGKSFSQEDIILSSTWSFLGVIYIDSNGRFKNEKEAFKCFVNACKIGTRDGSAENQLGLCYENGIGVDKDEKIAMEWYKRAANKGSASALLSLAINNIENGKIDVGRVQLSQSVEKGDDEARLLMGLFLCEGQYFPIDVPRGLEYINLSAKNGNADAMKRLGLISLGGLYGVEKDVKKAEEWLTRAAESGNASAECSLGTRYGEGDFGAVDNQKAVYWWNRAAEHGDVAAMYNMGHAYLSGIGVMSNPHIAFDWFKKAADAGEVKAMLELGAILLEEKWGMVDKEQAEKWFLRAVETGDADALNAYAVQLYNGAFGDADKAKAIEVWTRAADKKCSAAMVSLGECYRDGDGVLAAPQKAVQWFERAIELKNTGAMKGLAIMFLMEDGVFRNVGRAKSLLEGAAELGDVEAMCVLGMLAGSGKFGVKDYDLAIRWYTRAVEAGSLEAMEQMGLLYLDEDWDGKDVKKAEEWLTRAAESGNASAECSLGTRYGEGDFGAVDNQKAVYWWNRAAEHGDVAAMYNMGHAYLSGIGVMSNPHIAFDWFKKAADAGEVKAMLELGAILLEEKWGMVDKEQAEKWFLRAVETGDADALNAYAVQLYNGAFGDADKAKAIEVWTRAADKKCDAAMVSLGECYRDGDGVPADPKKAVQCFERAIELKNTRAMIHLAEMYLKGEAVVHDKKKALQLFAKAFDAGDEQAALILANHYKDGDFGEKDYKKAVEWYNRASERGSAMAKLVLGVIYCRREYSDGVIDQDIEQARDMFLKAYDDGNGIIEAAFFIGLDCLFSLGRESLSYRKWQKLFREKCNKLDKEQVLARAYGQFKLPLDDDSPQLDSHGACLFWMARIERFRGNRQSAIELYSMADKKGYERAAMELREYKSPVRRLLKLFTEMWS